MRDRNAIRPAAPAAFALTAIAFLFAAATLFAPAPSLAAKPVASAPYTIDYYGWLTVKVMVNGQGPYDFIIDTGATNSLAFQNLADIQAFAPVDKEPQNVLGMAARGTFPVRRIGELRIGAARLDNLESVILPDWMVEKKPQGILGLDFLSQYTLVFDAEAGRLDIYDPKRGPRMRPMRSWNRLKMRPRDFDLDISHPLYTVTGRINTNRKIPFMLDLGAAGTVVNEAALNPDRLVIEMTTESGRLRSRVTGALDQDPNEARAVRVQRLRIGRQNWTRRIITVHDAPIFAELGMAGRPFGLFGSDLVRERSFMIDFQGEEMRIGPERQRS